jgi:hypothetical protein
MARRRKRRTSGTGNAGGLGMVRVRGPLCRTRRGKFTRCRKPVSRGSGKGFAKRHTDIKRKSLSKCVKWTKRGGKMRCVRRQKIHRNPGRGRCVKWSRGRTRCMRRGA